MRFFLHLLLLTGLAIGLSSCDAISGLFPGGSGDSADLTDDDPTVVSVNPDESGTDATEGTVTDPTTTLDGTTDGSVSVEEFGDPVVEGTSPVGNVPLDLITSTDPEERIRLVQRDRPDPFDILRTTPTVEVPLEVSNPPPVEPPTANGSGTGSTASGSNGGTGATASGSNGGNGATASGSNGGNGSTAGGSEPGSLGTGELAAIPELVPLPAPPPPPDPETARAVTVTGVVQIGTVSYAIVNAPNEPHGRYVRTGQFLSNGQVLVKRIDMSPGIINPVVILEEFGVEVARQVGAQGTRPESGGADAAPEAPPAPADVV